MRHTYIGDGVVVISEATLEEMKDSVSEIKDAIRQGYEEQVKENGKRGNLQLHPKVCPNCKSEDVMYERYALTGKITHEGMGEDAEDLEQEIEVPDEE